MERLSAVKFYCFDHYGAMLWDFSGSLASQYFNTWNTCIKLSWEVPRATHNYFLDYLAGGLVTAKAEIISRYSGFFRSLLSSPCKEVCVLARIVAADIRSTTAKNLKVLELETGCSDLCTPAWKMKEMMMKRQPAIPVSDVWRIPYLGKLLEERDRLVYQGQEESTDVARLQEMIDSLCIN